MPLKMFKPKKPVEVSTPFSYGGTGDLCGPCTDQKDCNTMMKRMNAKLNGRNFLDIIQESVTPYNLQSGHFEDLERLKSFLKQHLLSKITDTDKQEAFCNLYMNHIHGAGITHLTRVWIAQELQKYSIDYSISDQSTLNSLDVSISYEDSRLLVHTRLKIKEISKVDERGEQISLTHPDRKSFIDVTSDFVLKLDDLTNQDSYRVTCTRLDYKIHSSSSDENLRQFLKNCDKDLQHKKQRMNVEARRINFTEIKQKMKKFHCNPIVVKSFINVVSAYQTVTNDSCATIFSQFKTNISRATEESDIVCAILAMIPKLLAKKDQITFRLLDATPRTNTYNSLSQKNDFSICLGKLITAIDTAYPSISPSEMGTRMSVI